MAKNLERSYDGVIIGAGHHGLVLGSYLAKTGLNILLVERRLEYGGGLSTKEVTKPGFYHNLHSINHFHISATPWFTDLQLADKVSYITPRHEFGQAHSDGSALVFGRNLDETIASVARFSEKDAATFREWNKKAEEITRRVLLLERYCEPLPKAERERLLARRTETNEEIARRLEIAHEEMRYLPEFEYIVINEERRSDEAVNDLEAIVRAERFRIHRYDEDSIRKLEDS